MEQLKKNINLIFSSLAEDIFPKMKTTFKMPDGFNSGPTDDFELKIKVNDLSIKLLEKQIEMLKIKLGTMEQPKQGSEEK